MSRYGRFKSSLSGTYRLSGRCDIGFNRLKLVLGFLLWLHAVRHDTVEPLDRAVKRFSRFQRANERGQPVCMPRPAALRQGSRPLPGQHVNG